jgi:hypothetical protein
VIAAQCGTGSLLDTAPTATRTMRWWPRWRFCTDRVHADTQSSVRGPTTQPSRGLPPLPVPLRLARSHRSPRRAGESWWRCKCSGAGLLALTDGMW